MTNHPEELEFSTLNYTQIERDEVKIVINDPQKRLVNWDYCHLYQDRIIEENENYSKSVLEKLATMEEESNRMIGKMLSRYYHTTQKNISLFSCNSCVDFVKK